MAVYWRSIYDINIPAVNEERKSFFSILNQLENGSFLRQRELSDKFIKELVKKADYVFKQEEELFTHNKCPIELVQEQADEHENFINKLKNLEEGGFKSSIEFITILKDFIINHIIGSDLECASFSNSNAISKFAEFKSFDPILTDLVDRNTLVTWTPFFETGIAEVDKQHRGYVDVVNDLVLNYNIYTNATIIDIIKGLQVYTKVHFDTEERYQAEIAEFYPDFSKHKIEHAKFIKYLTGEIETFIANQNDGNFDDNEKFLKKLIDWLGSHIIGTDKEFGKLYRKHIIDKA